MEGEGKGGEERGGEGRGGEGKGHEPPPHYLEEVYAYGQEVKGQGHTRPKVDLKAWRRRNFRPLGSCSFLYSHEVLRKLETDRRIYRRIRRAISL